MTSLLHARTGEVLNSRTQRILLVGIIGITLLGFFLRIRCLGCLGFRWDEDLTSLAVKALLDKGVPELPSGMIYLRFYLYQWVIAASVKIFGFSEFSMRLPAVLFGTILIPTTYWVTSRLFSKPFGLIVAACIAFSFWQVEIARTARMYAPFFLTYFIAAYTIFRVHFETPDRVFSPWIVPLALLALSMHQLAYSLVILLVLAIPLQKSRTRTLSLLTQAGVIGIAFLALKSIQQRFFDIPARAAALTDNSPALVDDSGPIAAILQQVNLPDIDLIAQVHGAFPLASLVFLTVVVFSVLLVKKFAGKNSIAYHTIVAIAVALSVFHQFNLVIFALAALLISLKEGISSIRNPAWYVPTLLCLAIFLVWLIAIAMISASSNAEIELASQGYRKLIRALVDYPNFRLFWSYVLERPLLSLPLALGTLWGIDKIARKTPDATALFLVGGFWLVLFVNGILDTKFEFFRYDMHVDPLYLMLVVAGLFAAPDLFAKSGFSFADRLKAFSTKPVYAVIVTVIAIAGVNPAGAILTSTRDYSETAFPYPQLGLDEYEDFATPGAYVREQMTEGDLILVLDPREFWNYIGRVDYWIWTTNYESQTYQDGGRTLDRYLGIPVLHSKDDVQNVLAGRNGKNAWLLYSRSRLARTPWVSEELKEFLTTLDDNIVYTGRDGQTVVIRMTGSSEEP